MPRFYITLTWDDWPEGGSYGNVVEAKDSTEAEVKIIEEMVDAREESWAVDLDPSDYETEAEYEAELNKAREEFKADYAPSWHLVDCWDVDDFIKRHTMAVSEAPNWEAFGRGIMENWEDHCDVDAADKFELARKFNILQPIKEGFDPEVHEDEYGDAEPGYPWFNIVPERAD